MKTMFNENIKIQINESGGLEEYNYTFFKEGFEEWAEELDISLADADQLKQYLVESGYGRKIKIEEEE